MREEAQYESAMVLFQSEQMRERLNSLEQEIEQARERKDSDTQHTSPVSDEKAEEIPNNDKYGSVVPYVPQYPLPTNGIGHDSYLEIASASDFIQSTELGVQRFFKESDVYAYVRAARGTLEAYE